MVITFCLHLYEKCTCIPVKKQLGYFFHKKKIFQKKKKEGVYQPMNMNPYLGFRKVVNFKSLFFSIIQMLHKELK
jgi:hypothetical protein